MGLVQKSTKRHNRNKKFIQRIFPLLEYFKQHGTIEGIKQTDTIIINGKEIQIGWLVTNLRQDRRKNLLLDTDILLLDYLGMDWGKVLDKHLEVLDAYFLKNGTLADLTQYSGDFLYEGEMCNLGNIVQYIRKSDKLSKDQIQLLSQRGFKFSPRSVENVLYPLRMYFEEYGSIANITANTVYTIDDKTYNIGRTLNYFKTKYNKGQLKEAYIKEFVEMGMKWSTKDIDENIIEI